MVFVSLVVCFTAFSSFSHDKNLQTNLLSYTQTKHFSGAYRRDCKKKIPDEK